MSRLTSVLPVRARSRSDPHGMRGSSPSRESSPRGRNDMLSPSPSGVGSRSASPSYKTGNRRASTSSVQHNRDYLLDLADPHRPTSQAAVESATNGSDASPSSSTGGGGNSSAGAGSGHKRTQKHPATFQCSLCPKRFTRAYNLRSHLRTHTDERPFVCSVCGKAFARQHDRKRHEGLHSGDKKFVCKGALRDGNAWGCGRRFARADALGRHFRSEAGRVCIKPLMDEEVEERAGLIPGVGPSPQSSSSTAVSAAAHHHPQHQLSGQLPGGIMMHDPATGLNVSAPPGMQTMGYGDPTAGVSGPPPYGYAHPQQQAPGMYRLPMALLQQYPEMHSVWETLPAHGEEGGNGNGGGRGGRDGSGTARSSFDAGSAGEYHDHDLDGEHEHDHDLEVDEAGFEEGRFDAGGGAVGTAAFGWVSDSGC